MLCWVLTVPIMLLVCPSTHPARRAAAGYPALRALAICLRARSGMRGAAGADTTCDAAGDDDHWCLMLPRNQQQATELFEVRTACPGEDVELIFAHDSPGLSEHEATRVPYDAGADLSYGTSTGRGKQHPLLW
eukprot:3938884-Rhodomonas_salina.1